MVNDFLKMGPHDVGGEVSHSIDTHDHEMRYWEKFSNGLRMALTSTKIITLDELRLTAEFLVKNILKWNIFTGMLVPWLKYVTRGSYLLKQNFWKN